MKRILTSFILSTLLLYPAFVTQAAENDANRSITVTGNSSATLPAETATIHGQVKVVSDSTENSYLKVVEILVELSTKVQELGLKKTDIIAGAIGQREEYEYSANIRKPKGFSATSNILLKVSNVKDAYKIHNELSHFQNLTILTTEFGLKDHAKAKGDTLEQALANSKRKAELMANSIGAQLGPALTIEETTANPYPMGRSEMMLQHSPAPSSPVSITTTGSVTIESSVRVKFQLQ
ncbi:MULTISPECIES: SIMPL domain-containing protein [Desulfosediminicola]|uniref:SIMPL domain-containing protein n=1 Tax=Desulfosediminicola TaxID=2886823 RepID=UPI0010ABAD7D|nr:SIMPL domain-containing protein [Desulfosediminicola ganghwensis]